MITANGLPVLEMRLTLERVGAWVARLEVAADGDVETSGQVTIAQDGLSFVGTSLRSGRGRIEMVGGGGGIPREIAARSFEGATAREVFEEALAIGGEAPDPESSRAALSTPLTFWTRAAVSLGTALSSLADAVGALWRVRPNGRVWLGHDDFAPMPPEYEATEIDGDDGAGYVVLAAPTIALAPGVTFGGRRVGRVEHFVSRDEPLRTTFWVAP